MGDPLENQPHQQGHQIWPTCYEVHGNEPALLLIERDENRPDFRGFHRYQTIFVWRNNAIAKYMEDMGPQELYVSGPIQIYGGDPSVPETTEWWETIDSLRNHADVFRELMAHRAIQREVPNLIKGFNDWVDEENLRRRHVSVFGKYKKVER